MTHSESGEKSLRSWKEIAAYLERDTRTAYRWDKEAGLPVRRYTDGSRSSVYAYPSEIEAWRAARPTQSETDTPVPVPLWRRMEAWAAVGVGVAAVLVITYGPFLNPRNPVAEAAEGSMRTEQVWTGKDVAWYSRLSADGKRLSFVDSSSGDLWIRELPSGAKRRIIGEDSWEKNSSYPETHALSRDGQEIAYVWFDAETKRFQLRVGPVPAKNEKHQDQVIFESPSQAGGWIEVFGWLSDSKGMFLHSAEGGDLRLFIGDTEAGQAEALKSLAWSYPEGAEISPDGAWIAYGLRPDPIAAQH